MTRTHIESLLASFPKLIPTNSQHTSVETAQVRYVYQPLEDLYILLITNKASNILQDIDTLHLFARVVSDMCRTADEREIQKQSFELLGAFDEIVSMGYREQVNLMQVRGVLEMESHEEKIQDIIARVSGSHSDLFNLLLILVTEQRSRGKRRTQASCTPTRAPAPRTAKACCSNRRRRQFLSRRRHIWILSHSSAVRCTRGSSSTYCIARTCV